MANGRQTLVWNVLRMTADSAAEKATPEGQSRGHGAAAGRGSSRADILEAVRRAEADAAKRREAAERRAGEVRAEGQKAAARLAEEAEKEGRALVRQALAKAAAETDSVRKERLAKVKKESDALLAGARSKFPELAKVFERELEGGKDA